jgi:hypothetical protein
MQADPDPDMLKPDLTGEIFAGHFLPALNA